MFISCYKYINHLKIQSSKILTTYHKFIIDISIKSPKCFMSFMNV